MKYRLNVNAGNYHSNYIVGIVWAMFVHRCWHWLRGDGWID